MAGDQPADQGNKRNAENDRNEHAGNLVGQTRDWCLGVAGFIDQRNNLRKRRIGTDFRRPHDKRTVQVGRSGHDLVADGFFDRHRFAGNGRLVQRTGTFHNGTVDWNRGTRNNADQISGADVFRRDFHKVIPAFYKCGFRRQTDQFGQRVAGFGFGARFEILAQRNQGNDHRRTFKVQRVHAGMDQFMIHRSIAVRHGEQAVKAVNKGYRRADRNERIHIRAAVKQSFKSVREEIPLNEQDYRGQEHLDAGIGHHPFHIH